MFVQVIQGQVSDPNEARSALDRWTRDLAPDAEGWLGTTAGVTDDGQFIALARFASEEAARRNSERAEQGDWWGDTAKLVTGRAPRRVGGAAAEERRARGAGRLVAGHSKAVHRRAHVPRQPLRPRRRRRRP